MSKNRRCGARFLAWVRGCGKCNGAQNEDRKEGMVNWGRGEE